MCIRIYIENDPMVDRLQNFVKQFNKLCKGTQEHSTRGEHKVVSITRYTHNILIEEILWAILDLLALYNYVFVDEKFEECIFLNQTFVSSSISLLITTYHLYYTCFWLGHIICGAYKIRYIIFLMYFCGHYSFAVIKEIQDQVKNLISSKVHTIINTIVLLALLLPDAFINVAWCTDA